MPKNCILNWSRRGPKARSQSGCSKVLPSPAANQPTVETGTRRPKSRALRQVQGATTSSVQAQSRSPRHAAPRRAPAALLHTPQTAQSAATGAASSRVSVAAPKTRPAAPARRALCRSRPATARARPALTSTAKSVSQSR